MEKTGQVPWVDTQLKLGPLMSRLFKQPDSPQMIFQFARMAERQAAGEKGQDAGLNGRDLLSRFMEAQANDPSLPP